MLRALFNQGKIQAADGDVGDLTNERYWTDLGWIPKTASNITVTPESAMALPAYFAAMRAIAEDIGKLPFIVYRRLDGGGKERAPEHPAFRVLHDFPNPNLEALTFRETLTAWALGWGNGYAEIQRTMNGDIFALHPIHPSRVTPKKNDSDQIVYDVLISDISLPDTSQRVVTIPQAEMFHLRGLGPDGLVGYSVARVLAESIGVNLAAQRFGAGYFGNNWHMAGVLEHPGRLSEEAQKQLRASWAKVHGGMTEPFKPGILEEGMQYKKISIPNEEAQFIETRQFGVEDIARAFRMPPHKLQHLLRATFSNIDSQNTEYVQDTLQPWLTRWEQHVQRKIFGEDEETFFAEHLVAGLLRGDLKTQAEYYQTLWGIGVFSINEIRERENMNPVDGGDKHFFPLNMATIEDGPPAEQPDSNGSSPEPQERDQRFRESSEALFSDCERRVRAREEKAISRAWKRYSDREAFLAWLEKFSAEHEGFIEEVLRPPADFVSTLKGTDADLPPVIQAHVGELVKRALEGFGEQNGGFEAPEGLSERLMESLR